MSLDRERLKSIVESLIFVSESPLAPARIRGVLEGVSAEELKEVIEELKNDYRGAERGIILEEVALGYQFRTVPENTEWIRKLVETKPQKLSRAALEVLAIIAYNQPVTRPEVEAIRGVDSSSAVHALLDKKLVRILGRKDAPGKPFVFGTTKEFLEIFNLQDLSDLPSLKEIESLSDEDLELLQGSGNEGGQKGEGGGAPVETDPSQAAEDGEDEAPDPPEDGPEE